MVVGRGACHEGHQQAFM